VPDASRGAAKTLCAQYDAVEEIRRQAEKDLVKEAHRHAISGVVETCPGLGPIRVAQMMPGWSRAEVQKTRGLNLKHNHTLKYVFKGAA
jgi:hypothetical protein